MYVATILPTRYLDLIEKDNYMLCLAQYVEQDGIYREFFRTKKKGFLIIDNGVAEGERCSIESIAESAAWVGADEIILSDVVGNKDETLDDSFQSLEFYLSRFDNSVQYMAVPQGRNLVEWTECAKRFCEDYRIRTIGISKFLTNSCGPYARLQALQSLLPFINDRDIHLLGCWDNVFEPLSINMWCKENQVTNLRGVDSGIAYSYTEQGKYIWEDDRSYNIPTVKINYNRLRLNVMRWRRSCNGV